MFREFKLRTWLATY